MFPSSFLHFYAWSAWSSSLFCFMIFPSSPKAPSTLFHCFIHFHHIEQTVIPPSLCIWSLFYDHTGRQACLKNKQSPCYVLCRFIISFQSNRLLCVCLLSFSHIQVSQLRHDLSMKDELLQFYTNAAEESEGESTTSTP